jgi:hypothetical protein
MKHCEFLWINAKGKILAGELFVTFSGWEFARGTSTEAPFDGPTMRTDDLDQGRS